MKTPITPGEILLGSATHTALKQATDQHGCQLWLEKSPPATNEPSR
jgi:hypothetical protein